MKVRNYDLIIRATTAVPMNAIISTLKKQNWAIKQCGFDFSLFQYKTSYK
jgi:hypothetical protein